MKFYQKTWFKALAAIFLVWLIHGMYVASNNPAPKQTAKPEVKTEQKAPEKKAEKKALAFDKAIAKTVEELKDKQNFPYTRDVHFEVNKEKKEVVMAAIMSNGLKKWVAMEFADTMIRRFSFWAATYNDGLKGPDNDSYGSLFDEYGILIVVGASADGKNNYYEKFIYPKMHTKQGPDWKKAQKENK